MKPRLGGPERGNRSRVGAAAHLQELLAPAPARAEQVQGEQDARVERELGGRHRRRSAGRRCGAGQSAPDEGRDDALSVRPPAKQLRGALRGRELRRQEGDSAGAQAVGASRVVGGSGISRRLEEARQSRRRIALQGCSQGRLHSGQLALIIGL